MRSTFKGPIWTVRVDDNEDCQYSDHNCALIEAVFQQRAPDVSIVCRVCIRFC